MNQYLELKKLEDVKSSLIVTIGSLSQYPIQNKKIIEKYNNWLDEIVLKIDILKQALFYYN